MAKVEKDNTVKVHYTGKLTSGEVFDSSADREPLEFTVGAGQMIPGFDAAVSGMELNEKKTVNIPADEAYGQRRDDMIQKVGKEQLPADLKPEVGQTLVAGQPDGQQMHVIVAEVNDDSIVVDANHTLAGKDLVLTLLVQDSRGLTGQDIVVITVEPGNRPPTATITTPSNGGAYSEGNEITFNGLASNDPDNDFLTYTWDLSEAGGPSYTASKQSKFSLELSEGQYSISLTVEDPDGESSTATHSFTVTNLPPVSKITSDVNSLFVGEKIQLSGEDSYDPEGGALDFLWNFGDNKTSSLKSPEYSWNSPGTFTVSLTVEDGEGQETTSTTDIEVKSLGPVASFAFSSGEKTRSNDNVTLDGSESSALGAPIKEYKWNFGNGDELTTNESSTEYSWNLGGFYNVTLTVVDEDGETGEITKILQVVPEDYSDEGQGNEIVDGNEDVVSYNLPVEIFVSSLEVEFTDIGCVGLGGTLEYAITLQDSDGGQIAEESGSVACGETASWNEIISSDFRFDIC